MATRSVNLRLRDIVQYGDYLAEYLSGVDRASFAADQRLQHAVLYCLEVIGEASGHVERSDLSLNADLSLQLRQAYRARNRYAHGYFGTDSHLVWEAAMASAPRFVAQIRALIDRDGNANPDVERDM